MDAGKGGAEAMKFFGCFLIGLALFVAILATGGPADRWWAWAGFTGWFALGIALEIKR